MSNLLLNLVLIARWVKLAALSTANQYWFNLNTLNYSWLSRWLFFRDLYVQLKAQHDQFENYCPLFLW